MVVSVIRFIIQSYFGDYLFVAGITRRYYEQYILNSVQNISLYCYGEEVYIFDCTIGTSTPQSCYYYLNVACTPGIVL